MNGPHRKNLTILLVEDDEVDHEAIVRAFEKHGITNPLEWARDGVQALELLRGKDGGRPLPRPLLMLLDLNLPRKNGIEVLAELRADPALRDTLVFVLTTSNDARDLREAYGYNIAGYVLKSKPERDFAEFAALLELYRRVIEFP